MVAFGEHDIFFINGTCLAWQAEATLCLCPTKLWKWDILKYIESEQNLSIPESSSTNIYLNSTVQQTTLIILILHND